MKKINIKSELEPWLVDYITNAVHGFEADDFEDFVEWARSFKREEAEFVVKMEFFNDWGYDDRIEVTEEEAISYAQSLLRKILDKWNL